MTNREIAQSFANGATKGRNGNQTIFIDGDVIYSYGHHWPIAVRQGRAALINGNKYSVTTSRHTSRIAAELSFAGFECAYVGKDEMWNAVRTACGRTD